MNITINEVLAALRRAKGNKQEDLAEHLSVTAQAVSKWERGECYPDITLLPPIAEFYGVTVDELLGVDKIKKERRIDELLHKHSVLDRDGKIDDAFNVISAAHREFPDNFRIIDTLLRHRYRFTEDFSADYVIALCERILNECGVSDYRYDAINRLFDIYLNTKNDAEKAKEYAMMLPRESMNTILLRLYKGEELARHARSYIIDNIHNVYQGFRSLDGAQAATDEKRLEMYEAAAAIYESTLKHVDYVGFHWELMNISKEKAEIFLRFGKTDEMFAALDEAAKHALFPSASFHDLIKDVKYTPRQYFANELESTFAEFRADPRYAVILDGLTNNQPT